MSDEVTVTQIRRNASGNLQARCSKYKYNFRIPVQRRKIGLLKSVSQVSRAIFRLQFLEATNRTLVKSILFTTPLSIQMNPRSD